MLPLDASRGESSFGGTPETRSKPLSTTVAFTSVDGLLEVAFGHVMFLSSSSGEFLSKGMHCEQQVPQASPVDLRSPLVDDIE